MLTLKTSQLPAGLARLAQPPKQLYVSAGGGPDTLVELLQRPCIAIVGSRKATQYGRDVTSKLARELTQAGVVIVSGLALGIDSIAHRACLSAGGQTIAVLPSAFDNVYPASHSHLAMDIIKQGGAVVSEYDPGTIPFKSNFIARNRIIAGLAEGVLITEAALKSGSLHTASFALEQGKTVLAVPGSITSPSSEGCNNLLKAGASVVTYVQDIYNAMGWRLNPQTTQTALGYTPEEHLLLTLLADGVHDGSMLQTKSDLSVETYQRTLTMLEITGRIRSLGANQWRLC